MAFKTRDEVLAHFEHGGDMLDVETGRVYISDCSGEPMVFHGIMVSDPSYFVAQMDVEDAVCYALDTFPAPGTGAPNRMDLMEAPGFWFGEFAEEVIAEPARFEI